jgi:hypothetical protein
METRSKRKAKEKESCITALSPTDPSPSVSTSANGSPSTFTSTEFLSSLLGDTTSEHHRQSRSCSSLREPSPAFQIPSASGPQHPAVPPASGLQHTAAPTASDPHTKAIQDLVATLREELPQIKPFSDSAHHYRKSLELLSTLEILVGSPSPITNFIHSSIHEAVEKADQAKIAKGLSAQVWSQAPSSVRSPSSARSPPSTRSPPFTTSHLASKPPGQASPERKQLEVTISLQACSVEVKKTIADTSISALREAIQQWANKETQPNTSPPPKVNTVTKLKSGDIRLYSTTQQGAEALRKLPWEHYQQGITIVTPLFPFVVHRVSKDFDVDDSDTLEVFKQDNAHSGLLIQRISPLRKTPKPRLPSDPPARHHSIIVYSKTPAAANYHIRNGFSTFGILCTAERYCPQHRLKQCFNCSRYGHLSPQCPVKTPSCGKCSNHHSTKECISSENKCANCAGAHPAWHHGCPKRMSIIANLSLMKQSTSAFYPSHD